MEIQQPNWLYCLSNDLHEVDATTALGKTHSALSIFDTWMMKTLARVGGSQQHATEDWLYCIFNFGRESYCYMHIFRNVTDIDLTYMRVRYGFNRMYLVDEPAKSMLIANVAESVYLEVRCNRHLEEMMCGSCKKMRLLNSHTAKSQMYCELQQFNSGTQHCWIL